VRAVAVTPDGRQIVTGGDDGTARLWDRTSGQLQTTLTGHTGWVWAVAVTPDGGEVVSVGDDGAIRVWNRRSGRQVRGTGSARVGAALPLSGLGSDAPTGEDLLQISGDVDRLAALAAAVSTAPPLSVALLGDWGSGKSSFMLQTQSRVTQLAALSRNNLGRSAFAASVRQVGFNAWHYSDEQVWTGLVEELFRALAEPDQPDPADRPDPQAAAAAASGRLRDATSARTPRHPPGSISGLVLRRPILLSSRFDVPELARPGVPHHRRRHRAHPPPAATRADPADPQRNRHPLRHADHQAGARYGAPAAMVCLAAAPPAPRQNLPLPAASQAVTRHSL